MKKIFILLSIALVYGGISYSQSIPMHFYQNANLPKTVSTNYNRLNVDGVHAATITPTTDAQAHRKIGVLKRENGKVEFITNSLKDNAEITEGRYSMLVQNHAVDPEDTTTTDITTTTADVTPSSDDDISDYQNFSVFARKRNIIAKKMFTYSLLNNYLNDSATRISTLGSATLQNSDNPNSPGTFISAEIFSLNFDYFRLGVGGCFKSTGDTTKDNAIQTSLQKIISSGGAYYFNFLTPLLFHRTKNDNLHIGLFGVSNFGVTPDIDTGGKTNSTSGEPLVTNQTGLLFHFDIGSSNSDKLIGRISIDIPCYYYCATAYTYSTLGISDFTMIRPQIGLVVGDLFNVHVAFTAYSNSPAMQKTPGVFSVQFSPSEVAKSMGSSGD